MSIAVLTQVYDETRRLAVAGSVVAKGDFRLKKLIPPLEQAGAKAPVFAKVAEAAKAVVDGPDAAASTNLLELASLVTAVLYTQGETGAAGPLEPIEAVDLGGQLAQTPARLLKPLLEALTDTGSGRIGVIKEAHQRGAFRDLRLVKPALAGLDDGYAEVADFLADHVVPLYGPAVVPELRAKYDPKAGRGAARRLKLLHAADPTGTRELVTQALEGGSKEVKIAAIGLLGRDDLSYLLEQAAAKNQDVRQAAYHALAQLDDPAAVAVLEKAVGGKDLNLATQAISRSKSDRLLGLVIAEIRSAWAALPGLKDKKKVSDAADRLRRLIHALPDREHTAADDLILDLFARRTELADCKGATQSGADVVEAVIGRMARGSARLQQALARGHAGLTGHEFQLAAFAARRSLPPAEVYDLFAPYFPDAPPAGKKPRADTRWESIRDGLGGEYISHWEDDDFRGRPLDPRWLDVAVRVESLGLIYAAARPGHAAAEALLSRLFAAELKTGKTPHGLDDLLLTMARLRHPGAADALTATYDKHVLRAKAGYGYIYWYYAVIRALPKSAVPALEAFGAKLKDNQAELWAEAVQALRDKPEPAGG